MPSNYDRAEWALNAIDTFTQETMNQRGSAALIDEGPRAVLGDLLCDIRHLCKINDYDFDDICEGSRDVFEEELAEERIG